MTRLSCNTESLFCSLRSCIRSGSANKPSPPPPSPSFPLPLFSSSWLCHFPYRSNSGINCWSIGIHTAMFTQNVVRKFTFELPTYTLHLHQHTCTYRALLSVEQTGRVLTACLSGSMPHAASPGGRGLKEDTQGGCCSLSGSRLTPAEGQWKLNAVHPS